MVAKKVIDEHSRDYMTLRRVSKSLESTVRSLNKNLLARPASSGTRDLRQYAAWKQLLDWETSNPMVGASFSLPVPWSLVALRYMLFDDLPLREEGPLFLWPRANGMNRLLAGNCCPCVVARIALFAQRCWSLFRNMKARTGRTLLGASYLPTSSVFSACVITPSTST